MRDASSDSDVIDDRELAAPPELVFEVWTEAEHFARWFAPDGMSVESCELDARPGGVIRFHHVAGPDERVAIKGVFDEVVPPRRLRFTFTFVDADDRPAAPARVPDWPVGVHIVMTVELEPSRRGTRQIVRQRVSPADAAELPSVKSHRERAGEGWRQTVGRLVPYLEQRTRASWGS